MYYVLTDVKQNGTRHLSRDGAEAELERFSGRQNPIITVPIETLDTTTTRLAAAEAEAERLREALGTCRDAIASLDIEALGMATDRINEWPIRDELLAMVDDALAPDPEEVV